jgi:hypothetical protein
VGEDVGGLLAALNTEAGLPRAALVAATTQWAEVRPALHASVQTYLDGSDRSDRAAELTFFAVYLMAQQRDTSGFALLCALARDGVAIHATLQEGVTDDLGSIFVRLFDGDPAPLRAIIESADTDEFVRHAAFEALAWLTAAGRILTRTTSLLPTRPPRRRRCRRCHLRRPTCRSPSSWNPFAIRCSGSAATTPAPAAAARSSRSAAWGRRNNTGRPDK